MLGRKGKINTCKAVNTIRELKAGPKAKIHIDSLRGRLKEKKKQIWKFPAMTVYMDSG